MAGGRLENGVLQQGGARYQGWMNNIGFAAELTLETADSIKITGADGSALSEDNYGWVTIPSATAGRLQTFSVTADVTIDLTGAHWGAGGKGNLTDQKLVVYAINNAGTLVWGVGILSQIIVARDAVDQTAATSAVNGQSILVTSALSADAHCFMAGWFHANFDDTGGNSEDQWLVQTGTGDMYLGYQDIPIYVHCNTNAGQQIDDTSADIVDFEDIVTDTHNIVAVGSSWLATVPVAGLYSISSHLALASNGGWAAGEFFSLRITRPTGGGDAFNWTTTCQNTTTLVLNAGATGTVSLSVGDTLRVLGFQSSGGAINLSTSATQNYITIHRVGD